jgi:hypothetical protein
MTPVNNPCHRFLLIAVVVATGDNFLTGDNDTYDKFTDLQKEQTSVVNTVYHR